LETEGIEQYTLIPNFPYLGFDIIAFTFFFTKEFVHPLWEQGKKWAAKQPNVVFVSTGQGMDSDAIMVSVHKDYASFVKFYHVFGRDWGKHLKDFKIFLMSIKGSVQLKPFSFKYLIDAYQKENDR
jgi:hypothetical protein